MNTRTATPPSRRLPRGSVYIAVLAMSALVLVLGLGGLASARAIARTRNEARDLSGARWAALSGIEVGRFAIERDPAWRTTRTNGAWFSDIPIGDATVSLTAVNPNGALNRLPTDPVELTATAYQGGCAHTARVTLQGTATPYTCLQIPLTAGGAISATSATVHASGYTIASNNAFTALLCTINANVQASLTAVGLTVNGTVQSLVPARTLPGSDVFDYYIANGTVIAGSDLPLRSGARTIANALLAPTSNPYNGALNAQGIYVIDAGNAAIAIGPCRIVGTLVIINASGPVVLQSTVLCEPAVRNLPCIMIRGAATINASSGAMPETPGITPNYNPTDVPFPWPDGNSNFTMFDTYAGSIDGLVYVSGAASVSTSPMIGQLIVDGNLTLGGTLTLGNSGEYRRNPPPGFARVIMRPEQGARKQVVQ